MTRIRNGWRIASATIVIGVFALTGLAASAVADGSDCPPRYEVVATIVGPDCGIFGNALVNPQGLSDADPVTGNVRVVGYFSCIGGSDRAFYWDSAVGGQIVPVPMPPGTSWSRAEDVTSDGSVIVGSLVISGNDFGDLGFVWDGETMDLVYPPEGGNWVDLGDINERGQVSGTWRNNLTGPVHALLYENGAVIDVGADLESSSSRGYDLDNKGQVVGRYKVLELGYQIAYVWHDGDVIDLGTLPQGTGSTAYAINDRSEVVGYAIVFDPEIGETVKHAFYWLEEEGMIDLGTFPEPGDSIAYDISEDGHTIVGKASIEAISQTSAVIWRDRQIYSLSEVLMPDPGDDLYSATAINRNGQITCWSGGAPGVLLSPIESSPADLTGDCITNLDDLMILLSQWGENDSPADFNDDGIVDVLDLLFLLANWG